MPTPSPARRHTFTIVSQDKIAEGVYSCVISAPALAAALRPGQFVNIAVPGNPNSLLRIPLSYASADPEAGTVEIWYAVVGDGTQRLSQMPPGATSDLLGPGGRGWIIPQGCKRALLVGGGIGVPPLVALARELHTQGIAFDAVIGASSKDRLVGETELASFEPGQLVVCSDDGSYGEAGFVDTPCARLLNEQTYDYVATCGPALMMKSIAELAKDAHVYCEASLERMMSCGFGACATCAVETTEGNLGACMCGPVFDASKVVAW